MWMVAIRADKRRKCKVFYFSPALISKLRMADLRSAATILGLAHRVCILTWSAFLPHPLSRDRRLAEKEGKPRRLGAIKVDVWIGELSSYAAEPLLAEMTIIADLALIANG